MSNKNKPFNVKKGISNLIKVIDKQNIKIKELKKKLYVYHAKEVYDTWEDMGASKEDINKVLSMLKNVEV